MLSRSLTVTSFMTKMFIDIWLVFVVCTYKKAVVCANIRFVVHIDNSGYITKNGCHFPSKWAASPQPAHKIWPLGIHTRTPRIPQIRPKWLLDGCS